MAILRANLSINIAYAESMDDAMRAKSMFGRRVRELRSAQGLSINRLATICGMNNTYLGWIERGEVNVTIKVVAKLASALGVDVWELFAPAETVDRAKRP